MTSSPSDLRRGDFTYRMAMPTRWNDNDRYGHVNSAVYYQYFDTVVNSYLTTRGSMDILGRDVMAVSPETSCRFHRPVAFPAMLEAAMRVEQIGRSSVHYAIAIFAADAEPPVATGKFVHVFVDRAAQRPIPIPEVTRRALEQLTVRSDACGPDGG
jgi:acyl-CoA thioester hydrolase